MKRHILEKKGKDNGFELRHQTPHRFVKTQKELRDAYLEGDFEGAVNKTDRFIMIRPSPNYSGLLVNMRNKSVNLKWKIIENLNFPTSLNLVRNLGIKQTMSSKLVDISKVFIPTHF